MIESRVLAAQEAGRRMQNEQQLKIDLVNHLLVTNPGLTDEEIVQRVEQAIGKRRRVLQRMGLPG